MILIVPILIINMHNIQKKNNFVHTKKKQLSKQIKIFISSLKLILEH